MALKSINPTNGTLIKSYREEGSKTIDGKIEKAYRVWKSWRKSSIPVKSTHLNELSILLDSNKKEFGELICNEMGKPYLEAVAEVEKCAWLSRYYAENGKFMLKDEHVKTEAEKSYVSFESLGVVLGVMPWNFPFWQVFRFAVPALLTGNTVLLKHASNVSGAALAIEKVISEAGFPDGVFQTLLISSSRVKQVIEHELLAAVSLTGSEEAGSKVAQTAGKELKKSVLELGGSDPFIVLKEANLREAAKTAVKARMINSGQSCIAAKRLIVEASIYDIFMKILVEEFEKLVCGDPNDEATDVGPLAREDILKRVSEQVRLSVKKGAKVLIGGSRKKRKGNFYLPTLMVNVYPGMPVFDEEVFGPVLPVIKAIDEEDAIYLANLTRFGLGASLWTENPDQIPRLVKQLQAGTVTVNGMVKSDTRMPFGGIKKSGYGRELSQYGLKEFVNIKSIIINR